MRSCKTTLDLLYLYILRILFVLILSYSTNVYLLDSQRKR